MTIDRVVYDIPEFCYIHKISRAFFYKLKKLNLSPKTIKLGSRVLITEEAAKEWRKKMEDQNPI